MKTLRNRTYLAVSAVLATIQPALADHSHPHAEHIETVEVFGKAIPATISTVNSRQLNVGRETGDSLRDLLGVSGSRMGGHGIDPTIRGLSQTRLNVLLDGAYVHGGCPNRMDPPTSYATANAFEEVTVIRGSQTLAYGGGGPGGTILFNRTTEAFTEAGIRGRLTGAWRGNSNTSDVGADVTLGNERGYVRLIANYADSDNYEDGNGNEIRASYEERGGDLILGFTPAAGTLIELSYDHQETLDALFPGAGMDSPEAINDTYRLKAETPALGPFNNLQAELYHSAVDHVMDNYSLRQAMYMKMRAPSTSDTTGGRLVAELPTDLGLLKVGIDAQYNERSARRINDAGTMPMVNSILWPDVSVDQTGAFAELGRRLTPELWMLAGLRYDHVKSEAATAELDPMGMPLGPTQLYNLYYSGTNDPRRTDHNVGGLLRVEYTPEGGNTAWYAGFARSVRTPDATERYIAANGMMPSARWVGNPGLEPETHNQLEVGAISQWDTVTTEVSLFLNNVDDYVLRDRFTQPMNNATIYHNVDARLMGGEVSVAWAFSEYLQLDAGAAYVRAENGDDNRAIAQTPPLEGYLRVSWTDDSWSAGADLKTAARQHRVDLTSASGIAGQGLDVRETPGWASLNLFASYQLSPKVVVDAGVDNVLDKTYAQHLNRASAFDPTQIQVNEPGRALWFRVQASL